MLTDAEIIDLHFKHVVYAKSVDSICFCQSAGLWHGLHNFSVDQEVDLIACDLDFQSVAGEIACFYRVTLRSRDNRGCGGAAAMLYEEAAVLRDQKINIVLVRSFQSAASEDQSIIFRVGTGFLIDERAFQHKIA